MSVKEVQTLHITDQIRDYLVLYTHFHLCRNKIVVFIIVSM